MADRGAAEGFSEPTAPPRHVATARCNQVFYSADGGATYRWDHAQRHPRADAAARAHGAISGYRAGFDSTAQARFLVVVSDGARWTATLSPAFTVD